MKHCKNFTRIDNLKLITEVTIPPEQVNRLELYVLQLIFKFGGQNINVRLYIDGSMVAEAFFEDNIKRQQFCETIEKTIDAGQPISDTPDEELHELTVTLETAFSEFYAIMCEIQPIMQFIDQNGGWPDEKTGTFPGIAKLQTALDTNTLSKDILEALNIFGIFMGTYMIGKKYANISYMDLRQKDTEQ